MPLNSPIRPTLETDRITLVPPAMGLAADVYSAVKESETELIEYLSWVSDSLSRPDENMRIAIENFNAFENEVRYYILDKADSVILGAIGLLIRDVSVPFFEIGYWVRSSVSGRGYITQAVGLVEKYVFTEHSAKRVEIRSAAGNTKSRAVAERCGYVMEAELVNERRLPTGELSNTIVYAKYSL